MTAIQQPPHLIALHRRGQSFQPEWERFCV